MQASHQDHERSVSDLLKDAFRHLSKLVQTEIALARAEVSEKLSEAIVGVAMVGAALVLIMPAVVLFLFALAHGLMQWGLSPALAYLATGVVTALAGGVLAVMGIHRLKPSNLMPEVAVQQVKKDADAARELVR